MVGVSFASADVDFIMSRRKKLGIDEGKLIPAPLAGCYNEMAHTHGRNWCPWQAAWLNGLEKLESGNIVYVLISEKGEVRGADGLGLGKAFGEGRPPAKDGQSFEEKFK